jgi:hypothetical protein
MTIATHYSFVSFLETAERDHLCAALRSVIESRPARGELTPFEETSLRHLVNILPDD